MSDRANLFMDAVKRNQADAVRQLLSAHAVELKPALNAPIPGWAFGETPLIAAVRKRNREMVDVLLSAGADLNGRSHWWAGGFSVLDEAAEHPDLVEFLIDRGAFVDAHAAARLGKLEHLQMLLAATPALVKARAGDGMLPLHFASDVEIARFLVESCHAEIDAVDIDHESTAAQYMVRDRQEVARYLVSRGGRTDILLAAALGDPHPDGDLRTCVSPRWFPMTQPRAGGSIYIWTLGEMKTAHQVANEFGHTELFQSLMERSPASLRLAVACELGIDASAATVDPQDYGRLVNAAKSNDNAKVSRMLAAGWPVGTLYGDATALHWASFHGNAALVSVLLEHGAPRDVPDSQHGADPMGWASYGSTNSWLSHSGDYPAVVERLSATPRPPS